MAWKCVSIGPVFEKSLTLVDSTEGLGTILLRGK